ncbi:hypothetical protein [Nocardioides montaniterrae]
MTPILVTLIATALLMGYPWHRAVIDRWKARVDLAKALIQCDNAGQRATQTSSDNAALTRALAQRINENLDLRNEITCERAYVDLCESELKRLHVALAGKAVWPTLADPDVVVAFPKRGVR